MAEALAGAFLSGSVRLLLEKLATPALREFGLLCGVEADLERLQRTLKRVLAVLRDAKRRMQQTKDESLKLWTAELRDAASGAEDVVDEFEYESLRRKAEIKTRLGKNKVRKFFSRFKPDRRRVSFRHAMARKIDEIRRRLDEIAKERNDLRLEGLDEGGASRQLDFARRKGRETSSFLSDPEVFGRSAEKEVIINLLLSSSESNCMMNLSVLPIVGMGGLGKTTLAQIVYNDKRIEEHFQLRAWVCVSDDFDVKKITKQILESAREESRDITNLDSLQKKLKEKLEGRRFLLVLDDVWKENPMDWERLRTPLRCGEIGSKVVVTTRSSNVANIVRTIDPVNLECLSFEDCWSLFTKCAFVDGNSDEHLKLAGIGREIVTKLKGIPLAIKTLGRLLCSTLEERDWRNILESDLWELPQGENDIMPALKLSYQHLPPHLKRCFAYCSLFPKDYMLNELRLIHFWMALGLIQTQGRKRMEDVGREYFIDLVHRFFFQRYFYFSHEYVIHDLLHDLALSISADECFVIVNDQSHKNLKEDQQHFRHLSLSDDHTELEIEFEIFYELKSLRTLILNTSFSGLVTIPRQLFDKLKSLRVLDLRFSRINDVPDTIGNLKHLRYLDLSYTDIENLPDELSSLYHLQTLLLEGCTLLQELPEGMNNLTNLCHIDAGAELVSEITGIGKLTSLRNLEEFIVFKEIGYKIGELKDMNELRGKLCIRNLENVENKEESRQAELKNKRHLDTLELEWVDDWDAYQRNNELEEGVLEGLQPPPYIKNLTIKCNGGIKFPSWMENGLLCNLESIHLINCRKWEVLPPLGQLPYLKSLRIEGMDSVKKVDGEFCGEVGFPSLESLKFKDMIEWEEWSTLGEVSQKFPRLCELVMQNCPKLEDVSGLSLSRSLCSLLIKGCPCIFNGSFFTPLQNVAFVHFYMKRGFSNLTSCTQEVLRHLTALQCLDIRYDSSELTSTWFPSPVSLVYNLGHVENHSCYSRLELEIVKYPPDLFSADDNSLLECLQNHLTSVRCLSVSGCCMTYMLDRELLPELTSLEEWRASSLDQLSLLEWLHDLFSLEYSGTTYAPVLTSFHHLLALERLKIRCCRQLVSLRGFEALTTLKVLEIHICPDLASLPGREVLGHLTALEKLSITHCQKLTSLGGLQDLVALEVLQIVECPNVTSLPGEMLCHLTALQMLDIRGCEQLTSLGLQTLTLLKFMIIEKCPKLTNTTVHASSSVSLMDEEGSVSPLQCLLTDDTSLLNAGWLMHRLSSLQNLIINNWKQLSFFTEEQEERLRTLSSLQCLEISGCENLQHLPVELQSLSSLKSLRIIDCPVIPSLPEMGLPSLLEELVVKGCPLLEDWYRKEKGTTVPKLLDIKKDDFFKCSWSMH